MAIRTIEINGVKWQKLPGARYTTDYYRMVDYIKAGKFPMLNVYKTGCLKDLFFLLFFVLRYRWANCPFIVDRCNDERNGPQDKVLDIWAREHGKTSIITIGRSIQRALNNPESTIGILSYAKTPAEKILSVIKLIFEQNDLLRACFPDIIWKDPQREAPRWGMDRGLCLRREGYYKEATFEAHGLIDGMPTGSHFSDLIYDDIETEDLVKSPEMMEDVKQKFEVSKFLGTDTGTSRVVGTFYHHLGPLAYIKNLKQLDGTPLYTTRIFPGTVGGEPNGKPVFLSEKRLKEIQVDRRTFNTQILCDPTPSEERPLRGKLQKISKEKLPERLIKLMAVDEAGERADKRIGDSWAIGCVGIEPFFEDISGSRIFILDLIIEPLSEVEGIKAVVDMYLRNGRVQKLGVEKVGMSSYETHIALALQARGRLVSLENGSLEILRPAGRKKEIRIEKALAWPLANSKIFYVEDIPSAYIERLSEEQERFPYWHDDGLDMLSYVYDMMKNFPFSRLWREEDPKETSLEKKLRQRKHLNQKDSWMSV